MKERLQQLLQNALKALRAIAWKRLLPRVALVVAATLAGVWLTFPVNAAFEKARRMIGSESLSISFADTSMGLTGAQIEGLEIDGAIHLNLEEVSLRPGLSTLWFTPSVHAGGELGEGWIWLETGLANKRDMGFAADDLSVLDSGLGLGLPLGLNLSGKLSALGDLVWSDNPAEVTGEAWIQIDEPLLFGNTIPLPTTTITFKEMRLEVAASAGVVEIKRMSFDGEEMWGTIRGTIELDRRLAMSKADLRMQLHFNAALENAIGPLLPLAGFRKEKDAYVKQYRGPLNRIRG